ncbi:non-homologous end-joining factor 1 [Biomphalaria pfeifferi]|uniref:Non-homologous end-joining factor 1 n=1 Tax=Biomphalaria pfeifferi TaxID=112525 RepID=A0AAD8B9R5_BIOPF|nr:non-homologous end-joining factor 1 [Biomphalaria pfeifferi]
MTSELLWRRHWKPDLYACPWKPLDLADGKHYLIKSKFDDSSYELLVTDLSRFWYESLSGSKLKSRVSALNPCFEAPLSTILDQIKENLLNQDKKTQFNLSASDDKFVLEINSQLAGIPFCYSFHAELANQEMGRDHLTVPLLVMIGEMYRQQKELFKVLEAKDNQIKDYKSQGAKVSRKYLETLPFDSVAFYNNMTTSKGFEEEVKSFGEKTFTSEAQELYRDIITKQSWLKSSPVKSDKITSSEESINGKPSDPSVESWANRFPGSVVPKDNSPNKISPEKSDGKSPASSSSEASPLKDSELLRRQALERKLELEAAKEQEKGKKKKRKLKF